MMDVKTVANPDVSMRVLLTVFGKIGLLSFGGPAGQIALMHRVLVDEEKWLEERQFLHALNFCMLLPGPEAMQLATYCGWLMRGVVGGLIAGTLFVLPGAMVMVALSAAYVYLGEIPIAQGILFGLKAAVLAIVLQALVKVSGRALKGWPAYLLALAAFIALAGFEVPFPIVILGAGLLGLISPQAFGVIAHAAPQPLPLKPSATSGAVKTLLYGFLIWFAPVVTVFLVIGPGTFSDMAVFFSKAAVVTFGGAYAVLAYVAQQAVDVYGWLLPEEMLSGLGLAETTPGPLILVLVFVGFVGAFRAPGMFDPLTGGLIGAAVTLWVTFVPCFLWIFLGAPYIERLRENTVLSGALAAITAAVVGVIASLSVWFASHVLFAQTERIETAFGAIDLPVLVSVDLPAMVIAATTAVWLFRGGGMLWAIGFASLAGAAWLLV